MSDRPDDNSVEARIESLEEQFNELDLENRIETIEAEQSRLRNDLDTVAEVIREQGKETPHIDGVEALFQRLQQLEESIASLRKPLERVVDEQEE